MCMSHVRTSHDLPDRQSLCKLLTNLLSLSADFSVPRQRLVLARVLPHQISVSRKASRVIVSPSAAMAGGGLQPILKLGVPVRGLPPPPQRRERAPRARGQPSSPKHLALFAHKTAGRAHAHSLRTPGASSTHRTSFASSTHRCHVRTSLSFNKPSASPDPTSCRPRGGASPSDRSASSSCTKTCRSSSCRRSTATGGAGARQHATADTLVPTPTPNPQTDPANLPPPCPRARPPAAASVQDGRRRGVWPD